MVGLVGIGHDITERKHAEESLRQSQNRYRALVETQTDFIVRWQPDGPLSGVYTPPMATGRSPYRHASLFSGRKANGFSRSNSHRPGCQEIDWRIRVSDASLRITFSK